MAIGFDQNKNAVTPTSAPFVTLSYFEYQQPTSGSNMNIIDNFKSIANATKDPVVSISPNAYSVKTIECEVSLTAATLIKLTYKGDASYSYLTEDNNFQGIFRATDLIEVDNLQGSLGLSVAQPPDMNGKSTKVFYFSTNKSISEVNARGMSNGSKVKLKFFGKQSEQDQAIKYTQYTLDFSYIASRGFGFGFEKKSVQGTSRKTIQQTKGMYGLDSVDGNFYVDTWGNAPDRITISGKIEIPHGYDYPVKYKNGKLIERGRQNNPTENSFIGTLEDFYQKNSNPLRVNRGEYLTLNDYYTGEFYIVTIKSRNYEESVDNPNIYSWSIELIVLQKIDIKSYQGAKLGNKGFLNTLF